MTYEIPSSNMSAMPTPTQQLADALLGELVEDWITRKRAEGRPWRFIVRDLATATGGKIDVTEQTLHNWMRDDQAEPAEAAS